MSGRLSLTIKFTENSNQLMNVLLYLEPLYFDILRFYGGVVVAQT